MIFIGAAAARRSMRRHQGLPPPRATRLPLWRLLLGEIAWAARQLGREPMVLVPLLGGFAATLAVLGTTAPGPVSPWPVRVVLALLAGLCLARGVWAWVQRRRGSASGKDSPHAAPGIAATEVVAGVAGVVLLGWLLVWLVATLV